MRYVGTILLVDFLILFHELGHFVAAKALGIKVRRFGIGIGPRLLTAKKNDVEYTVGLFPIGGFVLFDVKDVHDFFTIHIYKRITVALAGPAASLALLLAILALSNVITNGMSLENLFLQPFIQAQDLFTMMASGVAAIVHGHGRPAGLIGIMAAGEQAMDVGATATLRFLEILSANVIVLNLLPLPPLDGGALLIAALEKLHLDPTKVHVPLTVAGWLMVLCLMIFALGSDLRVLK